MPGRRYGGLCSSRRRRPTQSSGRNCTLRSGVSCALVLEATGDFAAASPGLSLPLGPDAQTRPSAHPGGLPQPELLTAIPSLPRGGVSVPGAFTVSQLIFMQQVHSFIESCIHSFIQQYLSMARLWGQRRKQDRCGVRSCWGRQKVNK